MPETNRFPPLSPAEQNRLLLSLRYGGSVSVMQMNRMRTTLAHMEETEDEALLPLVRKILDLPGRFLLLYTVELIARHGTAQDLPRLMRRLSELADRPMQRQAIETAIGALTNRCKTE